VGEKGGRQELALVPLYVQLPFPGVGKKKAPKKKKKVGRKRKEKKLGHELKHQYFDRYFSLSSRFAMGREKKRETIHSLIHADAER